MEAYKIFILVTIFLTIITTLIIVNKFVGKRMFKVLQRRFPNINYTVYLILFWYMTMAIWVAYFTRQKIPFVINEILLTTGLMWAVMLPVMAIMELMVTCIDKTINKANFRGKNTLNKIISLYNRGFLQLLVASLVILFGTYNSFNIQVTEYNLEIDKKANVDNLNVVFLADAHGFTSSDDKFKNKGLADTINELNPDIVLLGGDMIDELSQLGKIDVMKNELSKIKSKYGTYGVLGNHDYRADVNIEEFYKASNVTLLKDSFVELEGVIFAGADFKEEEHNDYIKEINIEEDKPIIYINHVPNKRGQAYDNKVDIQLSGHTHKGQVFPGNMITSLIFQNHYGYKKIGNVNTITTSGFGVWGPKVRLGSKGEIVNIKINFK